LYDFILSKNEENKINKNNSSIKNKIVNIDKKYSEFIENKDKSRNDIIEPKSEILISMTIETNDNKEKDKLMND